MKMRQYVAGGILAVTAGIAVYTLRGVQFSCFLCSLPTFSKPRTQQSSPLEVAAQSQPPAPQDEYSKVSALYNRISQYLTKMPREDAMVRNECQGPNYNVRREAIRVLLDHLNTLPSECQDIRFKQLEINLRRDYGTILDSPHPPLVLH